MINPCHFPYVIDVSDDVAHGSIDAAGHVIGIKIHHNHAAIFGEKLQNVVGHVSSRVAQRIGSRVAEDDRC